MANVKIYTTPTCPFCQKAKQYLKDNNIEFENMDVSSNSAKVQEMQEKSGQVSVPVLDIDGQIIIGFDKEAIDKALNLSG